MKNASAEIMEFCLSVGQPDLALVAIRDRLTLADVRRLVVLDPSIQRHTQLGFSESENASYSLARAVSTLLNDRRNGSGELDAHEELQRKLGAPPTNDTILVPPDPFAWLLHRNLNTASVAAGGALVSSRDVGFVGLARPMSVLMQLGAELVEGLTASVSVPRVRSGVTVRWLEGESDAGTDGDPTLGHIAMSPRTVIATLEVSRQLLIQGGPQADRLIAQEMLAAIANAVDQAAFVGGGDASILGLTLVALQQNSIAGTSLDADTLDEFQAAIQAEVGNDPNTVAWVTNPTTARVLKRRHEVVDTYSPLWRGNAFDGTLDGLRARSTTNVDAGTLLLGDFSSMLVASWGTLAVEVDRFTKFNQRVVRLRLMHDVDVAARRPESFAVAVDVD